MAETRRSERSNAQVVSPAQWLKARKEHLVKEKEFTRLRDELSRQRRELPWEKVEKKYVSTAQTAKRRSPICSANAAS